MSITIKEITYNFLEVQPELYSTKPNKYQIIDKEYGLYTKKDARIICQFLNSQMHKILINKDK